MAKSLAGPKLNANAPPDAARIRTHNGSQGYSLYNAVYFEIPQWITSPGPKIDPHLCNSSPGTPYDWIQHRIKDIFAGASGNVASVLDRIECYRVMVPDTGDAGKAVMYTGQAETSVEINPYEDVFRTDTDSFLGTCGTNATHYLRFIVIHEGRHAYQAAMATIANDADQDFLVKPNSYTIGPTEFMIDSTDPRDVCTVPLISIDKTYKGDGNHDSFEGEDHVVWASEMDAYKFADQYDE